MICKNNKCKAELPDDATFCLKCGAKQDVPTSEIAYISNETNKIKKKPLIITIIVFIIIACIIIGCILIIPKVIVTKYTSPDAETTTTAPTIVTHNYPMESCPIEITDISVSYDNTISKNYISAKWKYNPTDSDLIVDKVIFNFNTYDEEGREDYKASRYTAFGPFSENILYEEKWQFTNYGSLKKAEIEKIEIFYTDNLIENYEVTEPKTEAPTQPKTTKPKVNKPRTNTLDDCPIKVNSYYTTYPNSADGVSFYIDWYSTDEEEIKYIYFTVTPYNRVDDKQYCEIRDHSSFNGKVTGPFYYGSADYSYWDCAWYNSDIDYMTLDKITIEYMDGTKSSYY